ncbi:hypothetical protein D039_4954B, partial [Vibrio parahaemolyticus EKP-028]
KEIDR